MSFILNILQLNIKIQFIIEEYALHFTLIYQITVPGGPVLKKAKISTGPSTITTHRRQFLFLSCIRLIFLFLKRK